VEGEKMNERDYDIIEYCTVIAGLCLIGQSLLFFYLFKLPFTGISLIFYVVIGIFTVFISTVAHFKKILYVQEMKGYIKNGENNKDE
jgi:hypothetical protein